MQVTPSLLEAYVSMRLLPPAPTHSACMAGTKKGKEMGESLPPACPISLIPIPFLVPAKQATTP